MSDVAKAAQTKEQQRQLVAEKIGYWLPRALGGALLLMVVLLAGEWTAMRVTDPQTMQVKSVQVEGVFRHVQPAEVKQIAASFSERGFLGFDVERLRTAIEGLPWVRKAVVKRVWPDVLQITLEEQTAVARWGVTGLVNSDGELFFPEPDPSLRELVTLHGPDGNGAVVLARYRSVDRLLKEHDLRVVRLEQDERRAWMVTLSSGMKLLLGRKESEARLARFIQLYPKVLVMWEKAIDEIDLRYTNGFAVRWDRSAVSAHETAKS